MGHPDRDGQKAIRAVDWNVGVQSGLERWICGNHAINETALRGNTEECGRCQVSHAHQTSHLHTGSPLYISLLQWDSGLSLCLSSAGALCLDRWEKQGPNSIFGLCSHFSCEPEARVIETLALGLILAPLSCTLCWSHQIAHHLQTPHDLSGRTMLGPLPGTPFPYLLDLGNLTHCSRFSSHSTSSEEPPLAS